MFTPCALSGLPALGLCWLTLPGHHFLSTLFVRARKFSCTSNINLCLPSPPSISRGVYPTHRLCWLGYHISCHVSGWHVKMERFKGEACNLGFSWKVWENQQRWAHCSVWWPSREALWPASSGAHHSLSLSPWPASFICMVFLKATEFGISISWIYFCLQDSLWNLQDIGSTDLFWPASSYFFKSVPLL